MPSRVYAIKGIQQAIRKKKTHCFFSLEKKKKNHVFTYAEVAPDARRQEAEAKAKAIAIAIG